MPTLEHHAVDAAADGRRGWHPGVTLVHGHRPALRVGGRDVSWVVPSLMLVAIVTTDALSSAQTHLVTWTVLVPALSAALCGVWTTVAFALLAVLAYPVADGLSSRPESPGLADFVLVVTAGALAVLAAWLRVRSQGHLVRVENAAEATRVAVLRRMPERVGGLDVAARYLAADRETLVGGDFFEVIPTPFGPRLLLGDVQGKGTSAVAAAAAMVGAFREAGFHEPSLKAVAERLECRMERHNRSMAELRLDSERFATALLVGFPPEDDDAIEVINMGHPAPLAVGPGGVRELPESRGAPIGLAALTGIRPEAVRVPLARDESLLLVTDGVTEARDRRGRFLPLAAAVAAALARPGPGAEGASDGRIGTGTDGTGKEAGSPRRLVDAVERAVLRHTRHRLADDTAILAVRRSADEASRAPACVCGPPGRPARGLVPVGPVRRAS